MRRVDESTSRRVGGEEGGGGGREGEEWEEGEEGEEVSAR